MNHMKRLRLEAQSLKPVMEIGKHGITAGVVQQLKEELEMKHLIKVKLRGSFLDANAESKDKDLPHGKKEVAEQLALLTNSKVVQVIGHMVVLWKA